MRNLVCVRGAPRQRSTRDDDVVGDDVVGDDDASRPATDVDAASEWIVTENDDGARIERERCGIDGRESNQCRHGRDDGR